MMLSNACYGDEECKSREVYYLSSQVFSEEWKESLSHWKGSMLM